MNNEQPNQTDMFLSKDQDSCVHSRHCCAFHGCKYGEDDYCPVVTKQKLQDYPCEYC